MEGIRSLQMTSIPEPPVPRLAPEPVRSSAAERAVICLDGEWELVYRNGRGEEERCPVPVPFDMTVWRRQHPEVPEIYEYHRHIELPRREKSARLLLCFEGVNAFAEVMVDGERVAFHRNGFLAWQVEITERVRDKDSFELSVRADELTDQVSTYSHGGIIRSVYLYVLPHSYVDALYLSPLFDEDMETCTLRIDVGLSPETGTEDSEGAPKELSKETSVEASKESSKKAAKEGGGKLPEMEFALYGPTCMMADGLRGDEKEPAFVVRRTLDSCEDGYYTFALPVKNFVLWDAEHPNLYQLKVRLLFDGREEELVQRQVGLRRLQRKGNRLFVNHCEVKLRGVCRHETTAERGRATTRELIRLDVERFKEANCNYVRTSHYPPSAYFLELCDRYGIYVEDELALTFIARSLPYTQRDPEETTRYLRHFAECLARDYNHPSVIIWSLCNESFGGFNFDLLNRFAHKKDSTRFTKFSYPMTMQEEHELPDIWSIHYSEYDTDLAKKRDNVSVGHAPGRDLPVLHDEYVHVCCYNRQEMRRDPNVHSFWGESIAIFWDRIWNTEGALGGAIWAGIDATDIYTGGNTQLEWGIIDVWRRRKPEFYMTRKAYSPIHLFHGELLPGGQLLLVLQNRFSHTDLGEVTLRWQTDEAGGRKGEDRLPAARPGMTVRAVIETGLDPEDISFLQLQFADGCGFCVDEIRLPGKRQEEKLFPALWDRKTTGGILVRRTAEEILLSGENFRICINPRTGLLETYAVKEKDGGEKLFLTGGPWLNAPYLRMGAWELENLEILEDSKEGWTEIVTTGRYKDSVGVEWHIRVYEDGGFRTSYQILHVDTYLPKALKLRVGVDRGGLDELGIAYLSGPGMDFIGWKKKAKLYTPGQYSWYPEDHISRNAGIAERLPKDSEWDRNPQTPWSQDKKRHILNGFYDVEYTGSNDFRSTREDVEEACLYTEQGEGMGILGLRTPLHLRLEVQDPPKRKISCMDGAHIRYTGTWYAQEDVRGSDCGQEMWSREKGAKAYISFYGTGIVWYGPQDTVYGMADIYVDGKPAATGISQRSAGCDFSLGSAGYDKLYHLPMFSVTGLSEGPHTLCIEVCGEKVQDAADAYIVLDYFRVLTEGEKETVKILMNQAVSYPHLSWGNYCRPPIGLQPGTKGEVYMKPVRVDREQLQRQIQTQ